MLYFEERGIFMYVQKRNETKNKIISSYLNLLDQKDATNISVTDICEHSNINRTTFYRYYTDIISLQTHLKQRTLKNIFGDPFIFYDKHRSVSNAQLYIANHVFNHIFHNQTLFKVLMTKDESFKFELYNYFKNNYISFMKKVLIRETKSSINEKLLSQYIAGGYTGMIYEWIISDYSASPNELTDSMIFINSHGPISILESK